MTLSAFSSETTAAPADRRGPLRPGKLVASRARIAGPALSMSFRLIDMVVIVGLACVLIRDQMPDGLAGAHLIDLAPAVVSVAALFLSLTAFDAYGFRPREPQGRHVVRLVGAFAAAAAVVGVALPSPVLNIKLWLAGSFIALVLTHLIAWNVVNYLRRAGKLTPNVVIVGGGKNAESLIEAAMRSGEMAILGLFDDRAGRATAIKGVPVLGGTQALIDHKIIPFVDRIVICVPAGAQGRVRQLVSQLSPLPNAISLFLDDAGALPEAQVARMANAPLAYVAGAPDDLARAAAKRMQDVVIGIIALLLAAPMMALIAIAVRLDSPGPVFFRQRRHGFNNEEITVWKFRSMRTVDAQTASSRQVTGDDDRVTKIGKFIRRTSLDELPQIFNVLSGEMSLVGPRPHAIGMKTGDVESAKLVSEYAHRHRMKPGMTGWAAIHGSRGPVDTPALVRERVALDVQYIEHQSFWLDLYIMAMTIPCLLGDKDAVR